MQLIQRAKSEARGREQEILLSAGASSEWFDGRGRPCPKCGGDDRFSWRDETKSLFCRKCFSAGSNPDVVGSVAWLMGVEQQEAAKQILKSIGLDPEDLPAKKSKIKGPYKALEKENFNEALARMWITDMRPITVDAIKRAGGKFGMWYSRAVLAFPVWFPKLKKRGLDTENCEVMAKNLYSTMQLDGNGMILIRRKGKPNEYVRSTTINKYESSSPQVGIIGPWRDVANCEYVLKVEGVTDMLAANALLPKGWAAVTNSCGAGATPPKWFVEFLAHKRVFVIGDNDDAGRAGAEKWISRLVKQGALGVYRAVPPEAGMDLRDFIKGKSTEEFMAWLKNNMGEIEAKDLDGDSDDDEDEDLPEYEKCLNALTVDVLFENEKSEIMVYSHSTKKLSTIVNIDRLSKHKCIQICGPRADQYIKADPGVGEYSMTTVKSAISSQASGRRMNSKSMELFGIGLWPAEDEHKTVICNGSHLSIWDGNHLEVHASPRYENGVYELGGQDWYSQEEMSAMCIEATDTTWRRGVIVELEKVFEQWSWGNEKATEIMVGIVGATLMQSIFRWRPMVAILGESNTGKSTLLDFLTNEDDKSLFGELSFRTSDTTKAGIAQNVKNHSSAICIDEWDSHDRRTKDSILKALRGSTGGGRSKRGTAHHGGMEFYFRHLVMVAGIFSNIERDADQNRFIELELVKPDQEKWDAFRMIPGREAADLGKKMLAIAIVCAREAERRQREMEKSKVGGSIHRRIIRNLSVPAAFVSAAFGLEGGQPDEMLGQWVKSFEGSESIEIQSNEVTILDRILTSTVSINRGERKQVSLLLQSHTDRESYKEELASAGVAVIDGDLYIADVSRIIDDMTPRSIRHSLMRIPGAMRSQRRLNGVSCRCVVIPSEYVVENFGLEFLKPSSEF